MDEKSNPTLYKIRHSLAHVLAQAVQKKYPHVKLGFGPPIESGFYYDFDFGDEILTQKDLKDIEKRMKKIIGQRQPFSRQETDYEGALKVLKAHRDEPLKQENIENLHERGVESFSFYKNGDFLDVCEGPHVEHTGQLPASAFKLDRLAGAYWLSNEKNKMLTRIYALSFETREELDDYLKRRKIAEDFDHKKLGKELDIYHIDESVGKGLPLWLPNGTIIRDEIQKFAEEVEFSYGYKRVATPHITKGELYERSGHLAAYRESMFPPMVLKDDEGVKEEYFLKPMNCPHHHLIFQCRKRSYRDLPIRLAEYGTCYRFEQSGELSGLIRVRCMTMNDAHIYCRQKQFAEEFKNIMKMYLEFYDTFKLSEYSFRLSVRGKENADKFQGDPAMWERAEHLLEKVMKDLSLDYFMGEGEAAFYGPKIDIQFKNLMGREETVSTIQVDLLSSENFGLSYINEDGDEERPLIIHRAPLSTHERFLSFLLEYYGGAFPVWCAPLQVSIIPVNESCLDYCRQLEQALTADYMRVLVDDSKNSLNKMVRNHTVKKVPMMLVVGSDEVENKMVTLRRYGVKEQEKMSFEDFRALLLKEVKERKMLREPMASLL